MFHHTHRSGVSARSLESHRHGTPAGVIRPIFLFNGRLRCAPDRIWRGSAPLRKQDASLKECVTQIHATMLNIGLSPNLQHDDTHKFKNHCAETQNTCLVYVLQIRGEDMIHKARLDDKVHTRSTNTHGKQQGQNTDSRKIFDYAQTPRGSISFMRIAACLGNRFRMNWGMPPGLGIRWLPMVRSSWIVWACCLI